MLLAIRRSERGLGCLCHVVTPKQVVAALPGVTATDVREALWNTRDSSELEGARRQLRNKIA